MILRVLKFMSVLLFGIALITFFPLLSETGPTENQRLLSGTLFFAVFILNTILNIRDDGLHIAIWMASILGAISVFAPEIGWFLNLISS